MTRPTRDVMAIRYRVRYTPSSPSTVTIASTTCHQRNGGGGSCSWSHGDSIDMAPRNAHTESCRHTRNVGMPSQQNMCNLPDFSSLGRVGA